MKKVLSVALLFILCFAMVFSMVACGDEEETGATLQDAVDYFNLTYKADNGKKTSNDFSLIAQVKVQDTVFPITYTVDNANITITYNETTKLYVVDLPAVNATEVEYKITATISNEAGETQQVIMTRKLAVYGEKADEVTAPVANEAYKLSMVQGNLHKTLYALNTIDSQGKYIETTNDPALASDYYVEVVDGGYKFYTTIDGAKKYVEPYLQESNGNYSKRLRFVDSTDTVLRYDETYLAWTVTLVAGDLGNVDYCLGTYNDYATISISESNNYVGSNREKQFVLKLVLKEDAENMGIQDDTIGVKDPTEITSIADVLAIGGAKDNEEYTIEKYLVQGVVTEVKNTTYGNLYISDGTNSLYIYGLYSADGSTRYDAMATKPVVGDTITVMAVVGKYNDAVQMKNAWLQELVPGEGGGESGGDTPVVPDEPVTPPAGSDTPATSLVAGNGYIISAHNANGTLYFDGTVTSGRYNAKADKANAVVVYVEEATGGFYLYIMSGSTKNYIVMADSSTGGSLSTDVASATVFEWNATYNTAEVAADDNARGFGMQDASTFNNFSPYALSNGYESNGKAYNWGQFILVDENGGGDIGGGDAPVDPDPEEPTPEDPPVVGPTLEGEGTEDAPYILPAAGDYTAAFSGGMNLVWYSLTLAEGGNVTLSTTFATPWIKMGTDIYSATSNEGNGSSLTAYYPAGSVVYIAVGDWNEQVCDVPFTVSFESVTSDSIEDLVGTWNATSDAGWASIQYLMTINADGTGTLSYDMGRGATECQITYVIKVGANVTIGYQGSWSNGALTCTYADGVFSCTAGAMQDSFVWAEGEPAPVVPETPVYDTVVVIGENKLWFTAEEIEADEATRNMVITIAGTYKLASGSLFISQVVDAEGNVIAKNEEDYSYTLTAGEYVLTFKMLSMFGVEADVAQTLNVEEIVVDTHECTEWTGATCSSVGICVECGEPTGTVNPDVHTFVEGVCECGATETPAHVCSEWNSDGTCSTKATCVECGEATGELAADVHSWANATCTTPKTCSDCGATDGDALGHADANEDYKCDTCSAAVLPEADSVITIAQAKKIAAALGDGKYTTIKYYMEVIIVDVYNTTYGNANVKDAEGNTYVIYGIYSYDGKTRYDAMTNKPVAGDTMTVYGVVGSYKNNNTGAVTLQMKDAWLDDFIVHDHDYSDATCTNPATCSICGATTGEALGHSMVDGACENCGLAESAGGSVSKSHNDIASIAGVTAGQNTGSVNGKTIALDSNINVVFAKGNSTSNPCVYSESVRLYQNGATLTITANNGKKIKSVVLTLANNAAGDGPISVTGGTASELVNYVYTITADADTSEIVVTTTGTDKNSRLYVANIEVIYE